MTWLPPLGRILFHMILTLTLPSAGTMLRTIGAVERRFQVLCMLIYICVAVFRFRLLTR